MKLAERLHRLQHVHQIKTLGRYASDIMEIKSSSILVAIILVVSMPATTSVVAYLITKNPALRPLARTLNDEEIYNGTSTAKEIVAVVHWGTGLKKSFTQRDLSNTLHQAFAAHGAVVRVVFKTTDTNKPVTISYKIGRNTLGPTRISKAADSVNGAIAAYRMYQMTNPRRKASR